jgi:hypothetical protein
MLVRQRGSRFKKAVDIEPIRGKKAFFDYIGSATPIEKTTRHMDTPLQNVEHERRAVITKDYVFSTIVDEEDQLRMLNRPESMYARAAADGMSAAMDDVIVRAAFGTNYTGEYGESPISFPTSQQVLVDDHTYDSLTGPVGLTVGKLQMARAILLGNEVDPQNTIWIATNVHQLMKLINTQQVADANYNTVRALVNGELDTYMGFKFIHSERLGQDANGNDRVLVWSQPGIRLGIGRDTRVRIGERSDKCYGVQVFAALTVGASRMQEKQVVSIACAR